MMKNGLRAGLLLMCTLCAAPAAAQRVDATFLMKLGADTIMVEHFSRENGSVRGTASVTSRIRFSYSFATAADASVSSLRMSAWPPAAPDSAPPVQRAAVSWAGDSALAEVDAGGQHSTVTVRGARGAIPLVNPSVAMMQQLVMRARALSPLDSVEVTAFSVGAPATVRARVHWQGADSARIVLGGTEIRARVDAAGQILGAVIPSQGVEIVRLAGTVGPSSVRADYAAPAGAPYTASEVRVPHPGGFELVGTLTLPRLRHGRMPAVVTITGSGSEDRDEAIPGVRGYRPFRQVADTLTRRGIAVLRLDDRGFGASGGPVDSVTSEDFAGDIAAAVAWLRTRPEIDPERIALVGHSEGGIIAPLVAVADPRLRALVLIAGTSRPGRAVLEYQLRRGVESDSSIPVAARDSALRAAWARMEATIGRTPWVRYFLRYDPATTAARVRQPVLILQGATDRQVTADQAPELAAAIRGGGNRDVTLRVFAGLNHLMVPDPAGDPAGYGSLPSREVAPQVLGALADWLVARLR